MTSWVAKAGGFMAVSRRDSMTRGDREIIGRTIGARQRKMPPFPRVVHETLLGHGSDQFLPPAALLRGDRSRARVSLEVGAVVAGAHVDAALGYPLLHRRCTIGIGFRGIEGRGIVRRKINQREVECGACRVPGIG